MERLTYKFYPLEKAYLVRGQDAIWSKKLKNSSYELITNAIDRLAAYEDITEGISLDRLREICGAEAALNGVIKLDDKFMTKVPESWRDRCSNNGYKRYIDENGDRRYEDNNKLVGDMPFRPCAKCGQYPNNNGDDACLGHLGNVMNACCGHGLNKGYVQFDNGIIIRGYFEIDHWK